MRRRACALALTLLTATARTARAEASAGEQSHAGDDPDRPRDHYSLLLHARAGMAATPFGAPLWPEQRGSPVLTFITQAAYSPAPSLFCGLRVPVVEAFLEQPAGSVVEQTALGNIELSATWQRPLQAGLQGNLRFALGAPSEGRLSPAAAHSANATLALGSALEGWRHPELFAPGRLPLTLGGGLDYHRTWFHAGVEGKLPFLVQVQAADDRGEVDVHALAFAPSLTLHVAASPLPWLSLTARGWVVWNAVWPAELAGHEPARVQGVVQPQLGFLLGEHALLALDATLPLGGDLGGKVFSGALSVGVFF